MQAALARLSPWRASARQSLLALIVSRIVVVAAGAVGSLSEPRIAGWSNFDPAGLSSGLGRIGNALTATSVRWDSIHYLEIAMRGYKSAADTVYFPFYPLVVHVIGFVLRSLLASGLVVSVVSFAVALTLLHRLTELEVHRSAANASVLLLAFAPLSFFFSAIYTESLFLALSVGAVYAARREHWALAGVLGALAAVTRLPGVLLVVPLAWIYVRRHRGVGWQAGWMLLPPLALTAFFAYLRGRGYGWLAPITNQTGAVHAHRLAGPVSTIGSALSAGVSGAVATIRGASIFAAPHPFGPFSSHFESVILLGVLLLAVAALVATVRCLPAEYGLYSAVTLLVCVYSPTTVQPLQSLDRYTLTIFPLWMAAGAWLAERRALRPVILVGACLLGFYAFEAATWVFIA